MAITVTTRSMYETYEDGVLRERIPTAYTDEAITYRSVQVINMSTNTANQNVPFPAGLTTAKWLVIAVSNGTLTYSKDTTAKHHKIAALGEVIVKGDYTSLCLSNNSTATAVTAEVHIAG